jgi:hypothetical protein
MRPKSVQFTSIHQLFLLFLLTSTLAAQDVRSSKAIMSLGNQEAFYIQIDGADTKTTENIWKSYTKDMGKTRHNKKAKEFFTPGAVVSLIRPGQALDLYASHKEGVNQTTTYVWFDIGGAFANPKDHPELTKGIDLFMTEFYFAVKRAVFEGMLKEEEKSLDNLNKDLNRLVRQNESLHKDIEKFQDAILKAERDIENNILDQEAKNMEIENKRKDIEKVIFRINNLGKD